MADGLQLANPAALPSTRKDSVITTAIQARAPLSPSLTGRGGSGHLGLRPACAGRSEDQSPGRHLPRRHRRARAIATAPGEGRPAPTRGGASARSSPSGRRPGGRPGRTGPWTRAWRPCTSSPAAGARTPGPPRPGPGPPPPRRPPRRPAGRTRRPSRPAPRPLPTPRPTRARPSEAAPARRRRGDAGREGRPGGGGGAVTGAAVAEWRPEGGRTLRRAARQNNMLLLPEGASTQTNTPKLLGAAVVCAHVRPSVPGKYGWGRGGDGCTTMWSSASGGAPRESSTGREKGATGGWRGPGRGDGGAKRPPGRAVRLGDMRRTSVAGW